MPSPLDMLQQIHERLNQELPATQVIEALSPRTRTDAETWIRRLPFWVEFTGQVPAYTGGTACVWLPPAWLRMPTARSPLPRSTSMVARLLLSGAQLSDTTAPVTPCVR